MGGVSIERLKEAMAEGDWDQSSLARAAGCTPGAINQIVAGLSKRSRFLPEIAAALGVSLRWLMGEEVPRDVDTVPPSKELAPSDFGVVAIASIDLAYGMGGMFTDLPIEEQVMHFPRIWVESITHAPPELLTWVRPRGESMAPTINDSDLVLFDRSERTIREQDAIWVFTIGDVGSIKRLRLRGNKVTILSDNERVPPDEADANEINLIGRVVFIGKRV
jgi:phage repressor protein C with HTH and peptisase S24 domain